MKILFYLPVITPWWLDHVVEPLIRCLAAGHEVHVLAPTPWRGTGIGQRELAACAHLPQVNWHIVDDENHPTMRTNAAERAGIVEFVNALAPDYVLCRAADCDTVREFPGTVRYLMEGGAAPLDIPGNWIILQEQPFDHGVLPPLEADARAELDRLIAPTWEALLRLAQPTRQARKAFRAWAGIPDDRPVLALPLEYEHEENFFPMHRVGAAPNHRLIAELAGSIGESFFLAITNHPLNEKHVDNTALEAEIAAHGARMCLVPGTTPDGENSTLLLAREADGMLVGDSKVYSLAGFFGTPILRRSRFETGAWLNAYTEIDDFVSAVAEGNAVAPDRDEARIWFAFHIANNLLDPTDRDLTAAELLSRMDRPVDRARWAQSFARFDARPRGN
ncbi:hypothetical protein MZO42_03260 [Sphingomonas psychrotolerans]|uniref:Glycosyltransferase family 1 protein n=1 Tax=Sphingomonas psychrotolerans TaxID=1327635 RepID=A0ABU3MZI8_9SPHN|nr:hypothetical protein [Sphingomonas psychrotolerans]MDT8757707.1 hypothetical protein [Sphingomonas psychrotolerans]